MPTNTASLVEDTAFEYGRDAAILSMDARPELCFDLDRLDAVAHPQAFDDAIAIPGSHHLDIADLSAAVHEGIEHAFIHADTEG
jgi:hypothetical protein